MLYADLRAVQSLSLSQGVGFGVVDPAEVAQRRDIIRAIRTVNAAIGAESSSELRFAIEPDTGQVLIRLVDSVTNEVIEQVPPDSLLRTAAALRALQHGGDGPDS